MYRFLFAIVFFGKRKNNTQKRDYKNFPYLVCTKNEMNAPDTEDVRRNSDGFGPKNVVFYIEKCII